MYYTQCAAAPLLLDTVPHLRALTSHPAHALDSSLDPPNRSIKIDWDLKLNHLITKNRKSIYVLWLRILIDFWLEVPKYITISEVIEWDMSHDNNLGIQFKVFTVTTSDAIFSSRYSYPVLLNSVFTIPDKLFGVRENLDKFCCKRYL